MNHKFNTVFHHEFKLVLKEVKFESLKEKRKLQFFFWREKNKKKMFIKSVKISGFRHFGGTITFGDFSPVTNCILGMNGTGKSTFFFAIDFVLLEKYAILTPPQRAGLLHTGTTHSQQAFVEILFNNSDRKFPIEKDEFTIRRSVSLQKDEIFIDRKHSTRQEVINLFNAIDVSLKNGIFSVGQGEVKRIMSISDRERLALLNSVCGVDGFTEKIQESERVFKEAEANKKRIENSLEYIKDQIDSLEEERKALEEYNALERKRKAAEYLIYDRRREETQQQIDAIESERSNSSTVLESLRAESDDIERQINQITKEINNSLINQETITTQINQMEGKKNELSMKITTARLKIEGAESQLEKAKDSDNKLKEEINEIEGKIEGFKQEKAKLKQNLNNINAEIGALEAQAYKISSENQELSNFIASKNDAILKQEETIKETTEEIREKQSEYEDLKKQKNEKTENLEKLRLELDDYKAKIKEKMGERKECWIQQSETSKKFNRLSESEQEARRRYEHRIGTDTFIAIDYIKNTLKLPRIHGPLIDLINLKDDNITDAIDAVAGKRLFLMVAEDDDAAEEFNDALKDGKHGKLSCVILTRLKFAEKVIPKTNQMKPLVDFIELDDERFRPVVSFVFNGYGLCSTLSVASDESVQNKVNTVTMSGDIVTYGGFMIGGYRNPNHSVTGLHAASIRLTQQIKESKEELKEIEGRLASINNDIKAISNEKNNFEMKIADETKDLDQIRIKYYTLHTEINSLTSKLNVAQERKDSLENELIRAQNKLEQSSQHDQISEEQKEENQGKLESLMDNLYKIKHEISELTNKIEANSIALRKKKDTYIDIDSEIRIKEKYEGIEAAATERLKEIEETSQKLQEELEKEKSENDERLDKSRALKENQTINRSKLEHEQKAIEKLTVNNLLLIDRIESSTNKLSSIAPYPQDEITEFQEYGTTDLMTVLNDINSELANFRHLNKKADTQYQSFIDQQERLNKRMEEIDASHASLEALKKDLINKKQTAFEVFFSRVSAAFKSTYKKLVHGSEDDSVQLVLQRPTDTIEGIPESSEPTGVAIQLLGSQNELIDSHSGGQRTMISISLIFALQQVVPSPFYFFDEIDSDLDEDNRATLASYIDEMVTDPSVSAHPQFFYSSFKEELIPISKKIIGLKLKNSDTSEVCPLSEDDAFKFIQNDAHIVEEDE